MNLELVSTIVAALAFLFTIFIEWPLFIARWNEAHAKIPSLVSQAGFLLGILSFVAFLLLGIYIYAGGYRLPIARYAFYLICLSLAFMGGRGRWTWT